MCGIAGFIDFKCQSTENFLQHMTDVLYRRGPDDQGCKFVVSDSYQIGLGHRRLSIIDLTSCGHQPMSYDSMTLIFNGEIYNFREIRSSLETMGYTFDSNSDTEVVLKAVHRWGKDAIHKFNGMFSFVLLDAKSDTVTLVRDRAGVKPLYWYHDDGLMMFASELKSFHEHPRFKKELDKNGLALYLQYGYIPQPHTIYLNTYKLEAGCLLEVELNSQRIRKEKYWDVLDWYQKPKLDISENEAIAEVERILKSACEYRMVSDLPVGMFLSGGYDSSVVAALLQTDRTEKIKTFTIGFHESKYDEAPHAKRVAEYLGTDHTEYYCSPNDALKIIPSIAEAYDEPFGDSSVIPTMLVSQLARDKVSVSLSADGGDEVFGGYSKYTRVQRNLKRFAAIPEVFHPLVKGALGSRVSHALSKKMGMRNAQDRLNRLKLLVGADEFAMLSVGSSTFTIPELEELLMANSFKQETAFDRRISVGWLDNVMAIDYLTYLVDDILTKVDRATMFVSLEGREPLLDHRIVEFVARLNPALKINQGNKKYLLKEIAHKYLPREIMERPKMGFGVPIFSWFKDELREYLLTYLSRERLIQSGIFNAEKVISVRDEYLSGESVNVDKLWYLLMFEMWREKWA